MLMAWDVRSASYLLSEPMVLPTLVVPPGLRGSRCGSERKRPPVPEVRSPTVRRRELGALLRSLRQARGMTVEQVAAELLCSPSKVSRMETGSRAATLRDVRDLCDLYDVADPAERERMSRLAAEGKQQGWWQEYELPYSTYVGLEQEAVTMRIYQSAVVPGLFQVADYTRAIHQVGIPRFDEALIEERVRERGTRQEVLARPDPPRVEVILDEAVLRRPIGGPQVMGSQLGRVMEVARLPQVTVQVLSFTVGAHPALESDFVILGFGERAPRVVYVEDLAGQIYVERAQDVDRYEQVFEHLRVMASSPQDSVKIIKEVRESYTDDKARG
jgi:transcriptional regulator with XRE-family HTH domain